MNVSTNQTGNTADRGTRATRDIKPAKVRPITGDSFERRFCAVLIALIFATFVIVSAVLTHMTSPFVERLEGHVAIDSANGAGQEKPRGITASGGNCLASRLGCVGGHGADDMPRHHDIFSKGVKS